MWEVIRQGIELFQSSSDERSYRGELRGAASSGAGASAGPLGSFGKHPFVVGDLREEA